jgi:hypothetical protein
VANKRARQALRRQMPSVEVPDSMAGIRVPDPARLFMAIGRNDLPGTTPAKRDGVRRLAAASLLCLLQQDDQFPADGTVDDLIAWAELYASHNPSGLPSGPNWQAATRQLDELLEALGLPDGWALFEAIGRDSLPGSTAHGRAAVRTPPRRRCLPPTRRQGSLSQSLNPRPRHSFAPPRPR